jgi:hypothetical protein
MVRLAHVENAKKVSLFYHLICQDYSYNHPLGECTCDGTETAASSNEIDFTGKA